jgi:type III secretory pathway lipoprotein EscJ
LLTNLPLDKANEIVFLMQQHHIPIVKKWALELTWTVVITNTDDFATEEKFLKDFPKIFWYPPNW